MVVKTLPRNFYDVPIVNEKESSDDEPAWDKNTTLDSLPDYVISNDDATTLLNRDDVTGLIIEKDHLLHKVNDDRHIDGFIDDNQEEEEWEESVMAGKYKEGSNRTRLGSTMMRRVQEARLEIPSTEEIGEHRPRIEINRSNHQMEQTNGLDVPNSSSAASCSERKRTRGKTIDEQRRAHCPSDIDPDQWNWLINYWSDPKFKRKDLEENEQENNEISEQPEYMKLWEKVRKKKDGTWVDTNAKEKYKEMKNLHTTQMQEKGEDILTTREAYTIVLGHRSGSNSRGGRGTHGTKESEVQARIEQREAEAEARLAQKEARLEQMEAQMRAVMQHLSEIGMPLSS
uniref:Uncharacterized protein n=1 Tax=Ananas comosus var. bracteatus TaxID=296719 RepID=A0A6V7QIB3_ANACO|nr:unnamed protein product [Ananas comosus var. bracteatus]